VRSFGQLDTLKTIVPEEKETDEFIRLIQGAAGASNVQIRRLTALAIVPREFHYEMPFEVQADGPYFNLLPVLTAYENVELPWLLVPMSKAERRRQVETALELVNLADRMKHRPGQLSGGQQQRAGIARAIVTDPTLIVADEPTGDLDAKSADEILNLLVELQKGLRKTILMVTHDPRAASRAERARHLDKCQLVRDTPQVPQTTAIRE